MNIACPMAIAILLLSGYEASAQTTQPKVKQPAAQQPAGHPSLGASCQDCLPACQKRVASGLTANVGGCMIACQRRLNC
jgi:hypothetical protein